MLRYTIVARGGWGSKVLSAITLGRYDHVRLHHIMQADFDRELHNHPFKYRTFILEGWYNEQRPDYSYGLSIPYSKTRLVSLGASVTGEGYHRISRVPPDGVFTLFFMGKDAGEWGFLVNGKHVTSEEFFKRKVQHG
jgi:hypothetical protein